MFLSILVCMASCGVGWGEEIEAGSDGLFAGRKEGSLTCGNWRCHVCGEKWSIRDGILVEYLRQFVQFSRHGLYWRKGAAAADVP